MAVLTNRESVQRGLAAYRGVLKYRDKKTGRRHYLCQGKHRAALVRTIKHYRAFLKTKP